LQDFLRFDNPRQLMAYVGPVPGEHSSGPKRRQGNITKAGNSAARRMLVEMAWHYPQPSREPDHRKRHDQLPKEVTDIAWEAQLRLNAKFKRLVARRAMKNKAVVAVARELTGFVWAIGREAQRSGGQGIKTEPAGSEAD
jgi:transposase